MKNAAPAIDHPTLSKKEIGEIYRAILSHTPDDPAKAQQVSFSPRSSPPPLPIILTRLAKDTPISSRWVRR